MARIEEDAFGRMELPDEALYGIQTLRSAENMSFSGRMLRDYPEYVEALALVKKAAARANAEIGVLPGRLAEAVEAACDEILQGGHREQFIVDAFHGGGGIGANMNANEVIANLANERLGGRRGVYDPVHPNDHVNASQSTSDVCHTAVRLAVLKVSEGLLSELGRLCGALAQKAEAFMPVMTIARTCLQDAMAVPAGALFAGYAHGLGRRLEELRRSVSRLHAVNLGGTVIGSGTGAPPAYRERILDRLREIAGYPLTHRENLYDAAQHPDDLAEVSAGLGLISAMLIKMADDLRLLSSGPEAGFGELRLPAVQAGSSFFPGKVNPVVPETLIQCCFQVIGLERSVRAALEHGELHLNIWDGAAGVNLMDAMRMLEKAVRLFTDKCLAGIELTERCRELSRTWIPFVVELKEKYGYAQVSRWLKEETREYIRGRFREEVEEEWKRRNWNGRPNG